MVVINAILAALFVMFSGIVGFWLSDRDSPIIDYTAEALYDEVPIGGVLKIKHSFVRQRLCHVILEQFIFDHEGLRFIAPQDDYLAPPGGLGQEDFLTSIKLPEEFQPGRARYRAVRAYYCNPLQSILQWPIIKVGDDVAFRVIPR